MNELRVVKATRAEKAQVLALLDDHLRELESLERAASGAVDRRRDGTAYPYLDAYWADDTREPLLFRLGPDVTGFALVNAWAASGLTTDYAMAEFFVAAAYRRRGLGRRASIATLRGRRGLWEIAVGAHNAPALAFWRSVATDLEEYRFDERLGDGRRWNGTILRGVPIRPT